MSLPLLGLAGIAARAGAPLIAGLLDRHVGSVAGTLAEGVLGAVARELNGETPPPEKLAGVIAESWARDPAATGEALRRTEDARRADLAAALVEINATMRAEHGARGLLTRIWRPVFGLVFSVCFALTVVTLMRAVWRSDIAAINAFTALSGFLIFAFSTGAAVLGVYVWQRSSEKRAGSA